MEHMEKCHEATKTDMAISHIRSLEHTAIEYGRFFDKAMEENEALRSRVAELEAFVEAVREAGYAAITDEQYSAIIRSALDRLDAAKKEGEI